MSTEIGQAPSDESAGCHVMEESTLPLYNCDLLLHLVCSVLAVWYENILFAL